MPEPTLLPDSRAKEAKNVTLFRGVNWRPIFCANCGADGGKVPEENCTFAFYLCDPCAVKWAPLANTLAVPDEVFWQKVKEAQLEKYGRELSAIELVESLKDGDSILSKLARDGPYSQL